MSTTQAANNGDERAHPDSLCRYVDISFLFLYRGASQELNNWGFESEPELTQSRYYMDEVENEERCDNMIRDANDDKAEGRLLKASRSSQIAIRSKIVPLAGAFFAEKRVVSFPLTWKHTPLSASKM